MLDFTKAPGIIPLKEQEYGSMNLNVGPDTTRKNFGKGGPNREDRNYKAKGPAMLAGIAHLHSPIGTWKNPGDFAVKPWIEIRDGIVTGANLSEQCERGRSVRFSRSPDGKINGVVRQNGKPLYG